MAGDPGSGAEWSAAMEAALAEARAAGEAGEVPVGAVIVRGDEIVARAHNRCERDHDATAHAEILAIREASQKLGDWRLTGCTLVVTLEPCVMCAGAAVQARLDRVVYGAADLKAGGALSLYNVCDDPRLNHQLDVVAGLEAEVAAGLLAEFFAARR